MHACSDAPGVSETDSPPPEEMSDDGQSLCGILSNDEPLQRHLRRDAPNLSEASRPSGWGPPDETCMGDRPGSDASALNRPHAILPPTETSEEQVRIVRVALL